MDSWARRVPGCLTGCFSWGAGGRIVGGQHVSGPNWRVKCEDRRPGIGGYPVDGQYTSFRGVVAGTLGE